MLPLPLSHRPTRLAAAARELTRLRIPLVARTAVSFLAALGTAKFAAHLLDRDPRWLRVVFPAAALLGALGFWTMGRIRWRHRRRTAVHQAVGMRRAWREAWRILREDSAFRTYSVAFGLSVVLIAAAMVTVWRLGRRST